MAQTTANSMRGSGYWLVLATTSISMFVVGFNTTAILTALPAMKASLDLGSLALQWVMNAYLLSCAVLIAVMGAFADIFGKTRIFMVGLAIFAVGSIANVFAGDAAVILLGRTLQGTGAAAIAGVSAAIISVATPEEKRAQALGLWSGTIAFAFGVGPLIGGVLTDSISWRAIFAVDIVLLAIAAVLHFRVEKLHLVPETLKPGIRIDYLGVALLIATLGAFVYGLTGGHEAGWSSAQTLVLFAVAVICAAAFTFAETRVSEPLVNLSFFRETRYVAAATGMFFAAYLLMGVIYAYNLFVQAPGALNLTPVQAGLSLLPFTMTMFLLSLTAPRYLEPYSSRWPITLGMLALVAGFWLMHLTTDQTPYSSIWWKLIILGIGVGLAYALLPRLGLRALPDESAGQGSGVINTCIYLGASVGIAVSGIVSDAIRRHEVASAIEGLQPAPSNTRALEVVLTHGSQSDVSQALAGLSPETAEKIKSAMQAVLDDAFVGVMDMMAIVALIGAALAFVLIRRGKPKTGA